ncbi:nucleotidyltransferase family protein [Methanospirillum lacunae]
MHRVDTLEEVKEIINLHRPSLQEKYHISKIAIFGSAANNTLNEQSDIDILVEFNKAIGFFNLVHLQDELRTMLGRNVDLTTPGALHPLLRSSIMQDLVYV